MVRSWVKLCFLALSRACHASRSVRSPPTNSNSTLQLITLPRPSISWSLKARPTSPVAIPKYSPVDLRKMCLRLQELQCEVPVGSFGAVAASVSNLGRNVAGPMVSPVVPTALICWYCVPSSKHTSCSFVMRAYCSFIQGSVC